MLQKDTQLDQLRGLIERNITRSDVFLVDLELKSSSKSPALSVYVESDAGGIKLDDCALISRQLQTVIEAHDLLGERFTLNVSSPGLDRPLKLVRQYHLNKGRTAKVKHQSETEKGPKVLVNEGLLKEVNDEGIVLEAAKTDSFIRFEDIIETKIVPTF
ncbi:MAG: hypothetical protein LAT75_02630 [Candidatus Cyclonatronum sp.]|uniref:ribosome maturation factor RimP n=1 Tax=Cyclonatronum sp. TaxID=3024185 RepID=UPI0025C5365A|nr:hypothetical protein [Cyclonatronum sp.]MCC5933058.1 hypothetical protein [Balneolales bacterium]MCH8485731.1 hypothetical protein [Cyclonatronum sp.]